MFQSARLFPPRLTRALAGIGLALALAAGTLHPVQAADITPEQKTAIEAIVRDYIINHPEVLQEAMVELEKRQQQAQQSAQRDALATEKATLFESPHATVIGNPKGDVTLVEFFDYNCPYCKRALGDVTELAKADPNLRIIVRDFPMLGQESVEASKVALAVKQQLAGDEFFEFHTKLMGTKGRVGKERAVAVAKELGVDMARLTKDEASPEIQAAIDESVRLGDKLGLTGTPSFIIGDEVVSGAVGVDPLKQAVAAVRKCGKATC
jgi:protein-disulfide isomerase